MKAYDIAPTIRVAPPHFTSTGTQVKLHAYEVATAWSVALSTNSDGLMRLYGTPLDVVADPSRIALGEIHYNGARLLVRQGTLELLEMYADDLSDYLADDVHSLAIGESLRLDEESKIIIAIMVKAREVGDWGRVVGVSKALADRRDRAEKELEEINSAIEVAKALLGESFE